MTDTLFDAIPVITETAINFEQFVSIEELQGLNEQGRVVPYQRPRTESRGMMVSISNILGSAEDGNYADAGTEEFMWGEANQPPSPGIPQGLRSWSDFNSDEEGAAMIEAAKTALMSMIKVAVPVLRNPNWPTGMTVKIAARMQRILSRLRWDNPANNEVLVYVQFGADNQFTKVFKSLQYTFWPDARIASVWPKQDGELDAAYSARLAVAMAANNVGRLTQLMDLAEFKQLARKEYEKAFSEVKASVTRYSGINVTTLMTGFDPSYQAIRAAAGPLPAPPEQVTEG